jgi:hypothetical protein
VERRIRQPATTELGRGDNNGLFRIEVTNRYADIQTNEYGEMAARSVMVGATATSELRPRFIRQGRGVEVAAASRRQCRWHRFGRSYPVVGALTNAGHGAAGNDNTIKLTVDH